MKIRTVLIEGVRTLQYTYDCGDDMRFSCTMFCEIGEPYKADARKLLAQPKYKDVIYGHELSVKPWMADALPPRKRRNA